MESYRKCKYIYILSSSIVDSYDSAHNFVHVDFMTLITSLLFTTYCAWNQGQTVTTFTL